MNKWLYLILGSIAGGVLRYLFAGAVYNRVGTNFPYGTLAVNLTGCLFIGIFNSLAEEKFLLGPHERMLLMTGFCGAYTTFSTLILETSNLMREGEVGFGCLNILISVVAGFLLFRLGALIAKVI